MQIDPNQVQWDEPQGSTAPEPAAQGIDLSAVQWDEPTKQPGVEQAPAPTYEAQNQPAPTFGDRAKDVARQVGLTARYGLEGVGQAAEMFTEPVAGVMRMAGVPTERMGKIASNTADAIGLPTPQNAQERVVGDATRFMAGGAGMVGAANKVAQSASGLTQAAAQFMAANPGSQLAGAAGAGAGSSMAREGGGNEMAQAAAGLAGGLTASGLVQAASSLAGKAGSILLPVQAKKAEQRINEALSSAGIDWAEVPDGVRVAMRAEVQKAMGAGQALDPAALSRLLDFKRVGATPTRGTLTLDPAQITREQNLSRMGINSNDAGLHGLAKVQNENNSALIGALNRMGAAGADDVYGAGSQAIGALQRGVDAEKANISSLYSQARDSAGRSFPLDGQAFTSTASKLLDDALLGGALPPSVSQHLNRIAMGEVPFTVDYAEQLKTAMGKLQRATNDGQTRMALGVVRQALDDAPLRSLGDAGPAAGARPIGGQQMYAGGTDAGEQAIEAFNRARAANREMMQRVERIPGLKAVYEGTATPDDFVQKYVISSSAKAQDAKQLADELRRSDPEALEAVRASIAGHLKQAAIGSASDETGKFSASSYNRALMKLGQRKLEQFFSKEELAQLKAVGRVSQYTTVQPVGSAVNNSNSGALLMGRGLDFLDQLAGKVPLLGIGPTVSTAARGIQQSQAQNIAPALVRRAAQQQNAMPAWALGTAMAVGQ